MTNTELTLDQLQAVAGGATAIEYGLMAACVPTLNTTTLTRPKTELKTAVSNALLDQDYSRNAPPRAGFFIA